MTLQLHDTLTRSVRPVRVPGPGGQVTMYSCGPTVYRYVHVGNLRTFLLPDLIRRALLFHGVDVRHVQNITDVGHLRDERFDRGEDRMLVAAGLENRTPAQIANAYEAAFHRDAAAMNLLPAHAYPRATEHIPEMLALAERLEDLGHAYRTAAGNLYYDVASYPEYGRLSGNTLDALRAGHRGEIEADKRDPADFAIWKAAGPGRLLKWPSPRWGDGYPGWHLECSAMAMRHLGERFDIHTGGEDNVFPHHEDEIAQAAPLVGGPPAHQWVHGAHLLMAGRKMAKSAGNFQRVTELADAGLEPLAFRYLCLTARYSHHLDYSDASIAAAAATLATLRSRLRALGATPASGAWSAPPVLAAGRAPDRPIGTVLGMRGHALPDEHGEPPLVDRAAVAGPPDGPLLSPAGRDLRERFIAAIDDDLDLPTAIATVHAILHSELTADERRWLVLDADAVLGLDLHRVWETHPPVAADAPRVDRLLADRARSRAAHDWAEADRLREELRALGIEPVDHPDGTSEGHPVETG